MGVVDLVFCVACLAAANFALGLDAAPPRTVTVANLVFGVAAAAIVFAPVPDTVKGLLFRRLHTS